MHVPSKLDEYKMAVAYYREENERLRGTLEKIKDGHSADPQLDAIRALEPRK